MSYMERYANRVRPWQLRYLREKAARKRGTHTPQEWTRLVELCGHRCVACGRDDVGIEKDHIMPISRGGSDAITNLQPLCARCNNRKGTAAVDHRPPATLAAIRKTQCASAK